MPAQWAPALPWVLAASVAALALVVFRRWVEALLRLVLRSGAGAAFLSLLSALGVGLGVNAFTALTLGLLGAPGFGLLLMLNWLL